MQNARHTGSVTRLAVLAVSAVLVLCASSWVGHASEEEGGLPDGTPAAVTAADEPGAASSSGLQVPPGAMTGTVTGTDGVTPLVGVQVVLVDPATGQELGSVVTGTDGGYVLASVPTGTWTLSVGEPGITIALQVTEDADAVSVNAVIPEVLVLPSPAGAPAGVAASPIAATIVATGDGVTLMPTWGNAASSGQGPPATPPTYPGPPPQAGPPPWAPGPPPWAPGPPPWAPGPPPWAPPWISPIVP